MSIDRDAVLAWFAELQRVYAANRGRLTELDSAIGDADHGINMDRGFTAVQAELARNSPEAIGAIFKVVATTLIKTVGGASGPLYGTFFLRAAAVCPDRPALEAGDIAALVRAGVDGIVQRGKAAAGDKTMVDALLPALAALESGAAAGKPVGEVLEATVAAAQAGVEATISMEARKGRASYLGPRSVGHADPGATSSYLLIRAAADVWRSA